LINILQAREHTGLFIVSFINSLKAFPVYLSATNRQQALYPDVDLVLRDEESDSNICRLYYSSYAFLDHGRRHTGR
jgi:hypothetical protein